MDVDISKPITKGGKSRAHAIAKLEVRRGERKREKEGEKEAVF